MTVQQAQPTFLHPTAAAVTPSPLCLPYCLHTAWEQARTQAGELYALSEVNGYFDDKEHFNTIK